MQVSRVRGVSHTLDLPITCLFHTAYCILLLMTARHVDERSRAKRGRAANLLRLRFAGGKGVRVRDYRSTGSPHDSSLAAIQSKAAS